MKRIATFLVTAGLIVGAALAGYWWGAEKQRPVTEPPAATAAAAPAERKILYYRNPMGLPDTSPVPKKDPMGMDYVPVYEGGEPETPGVVKISVDKVQKLGVRTEPATRREMTRTIRAVGTIQVDERGLHTVAPKFEGYIERLLVNTTGQSVSKGQALMEVYSPDLVTAQREYLVAYGGERAVSEASAEVQRSMKELADAALERLRNWDIDDAQLQRLRREGQSRRTLTIRAPANGVVLEKPSVAGMRFMPGEVLYQIADLSKVWLIAEVFEQDLAFVHVGQPAVLRVNAYPDKSFAGRVTFIYPTLTPETRTAKVRIEMPNREMLLKPAMFGTVELKAGHIGSTAVAVPDSAVIDSGTRRIVLVEHGEGRFEPREVRLGTKADGYIEVMEGVKDGENVVVRANFLIDAESNLKAALGSFGHSAHGTKPGETTSAKPGAPAAPAVHRGEGSVEALDAARTTVTLAHGPIATLNWPAMTMDFRVKDPALLKTLKPGQKIVFEMTEEKSGDYVIVTAQPAGSTPAGRHEGH